MKENFLKIFLIDNSDLHNFRFTMNCTICRKSWDAPAVEMSRTAAREGYVGSTYQGERALALDAAADSVSPHFTQCPICGKVACKTCVTTYEGLTMCSICQTALKARLNR